MVNNQFTDDEIAYIYANIYDCKQDVHVEVDDEKNVVYFYIKTNNDEHYHFDMDLNSINQSDINRIIVNLRRQRIWEQRLLSLKSSNNKESLFSSESIVNEDSDEPNM